MFLHLTYQPQWYSAQEDWFLLTSGRFECKPHFLLWFVWCSYLPCQWPCQLCYLEQEFLPKRKNTQYNNPNIHGNICLNILVSRYMYHSKIFEDQIGVRENWLIFPSQFFFYQQIHIKDCMHSSHSFFPKERLYHCAIINRYRSVGGLTLIAREFATILNILFVICHPLPARLIN